MAAIPSDGVLLLITGDLSNPMAIGGTLNPDGTAVFPAGIAPGTYPVVTGEVHVGFVVLGTLQIGSCAPTGKEQCKSGGWRNFPQYKNEGQCVASIVRQGS